MSTTDRVQAAGTGRGAAGNARAVRRALLRLGVPVYCELLSGVVAGVVDTLWVTRLGRTAVGAVALAGTVENVLLGVILTVNVGTTVLIAGAAGRGHPAEVPVLVRAAGLLWLAVTPVVALGGFLTRAPIARLLTGGDAEVVALAVEFFAVSFPGMAVFFAQNVVDGVFKGTGDTRMPMRTALLANACIIVLDPLLIYGVGVFPHLGVRGAALGMLCGRAVALGVSFAVLRRRRLTATADGPTALRLTTAVRRLAVVGLPASGDFIVRMGLAVVLIGMVARFGTGPLAAYGVGTKVILFVTMAFYALRQAAGILTARTGGAADAGTRLIARQSVLLAVTVGAAAGLTLALTGHPLMRLFTAEPGVVDSGAVLFWFLLPYLVSLAGVIGLGGVFTGAGRTRALFAVTAVGTAVQLPLAQGLADVPTLGVHGVWLSMSLGTAAQFALSCLLFRRFFAVRPHEISSPADRASRNVGR